MTNLSARLWLGAAILAAAPSVFPQTAYFVDGYHGGFYGHYPTNFTQYMVDALASHPAWKLGLEIEPETWDFARTNTPEAYASFKALADDQSTTGRIEFVNPAYGQSYLWNISGESVIQQLERGMKKIRQHFPNARFETYSSEEPCFTSALPGILDSFGFRHAVLKNPNTCWGGYTRAFGKELVSWIGPDGSAIRTAPRYEVESLKPGSTWETIAAANSTNYVRSALLAGIQHPVGMCLQDAGWRFGPWLARAGHAYEPSEYVTWRQYFDDISRDDPAPAWNFDQEDVLVSLVWGSQSLQGVAQNVRRAENQIAQAEKLATFASALRGAPFPEARLNEAWRTLLLSQHHDCWIVPYNQRFGRSWAENVALWTSSTCKASQDILAESSPSAVSNRLSDPCLWVFNTLPEERRECVALQLPDGWSAAQTEFIGQDGRPAPWQVLAGESNHVVLQVAAPSFGCSGYRLRRAPAASSTGASVASASNGMVRVDTDLYSLVIDPSRGGVISRLIARNLGDHDFVADGHGAALNELRGYFTDDGQFYSTTNTRAQVEVVDHGPLRVSIKITSRIASHPVTQWIRLEQGEPRIDLHTRIDWQGNPRIGAPPPPGKFQATDDHKAFYDDRFKLRLLFPWSLPKRVICKDAPFAVTQSRLTNTYYDRWSDIKNNILLHWIDCADPEAKIGAALMVDHTTSYSTAEGEPLALTVQFSGVGLWGRDYLVRGPTEIHYAILPHRGDWQEGRVWTEADRWSEPLIVRELLAAEANGSARQSLIAVEGGGWEIPAAFMRDGRIFVRLFNPSAKAEEKTIRYGTLVQRAELVQLNGEKLSDLRLGKDSSGHAIFSLRLPAFGVGTLRLTPQTLVFSREGPAVIAP